MNSVDGVTNEGRLLTPFSTGDFPLPSKKYFSIGEVTRLCSVKPHVLRYWEQEFPQLQPLKRRGNRRYYQRHDIELIRTIRHLLYTEGYTIKGAGNRLQAKTPKATNIPTRLHLNGVLTELISISKALKL